MSNGNESEIARFREEQATEEESSRLGLEGMAAVASHEAINARADNLLGELTGGNAEAAYEQWENEGW